jgi:hypothetical protein
MGIIPYDDVTYTSTDLHETSTFSFIEDYTDDNAFFDFLDNVTANVSGLPDIIITLVFSPFVIFAGYWIIKFLLNFIPLLGGGA